MKIVEQSYKIVEMPDNPLKLVEMAARNCYDSHDKIGCNDLSKSCYKNNDDRVICSNTICNYHSSHRLLRALIKKKHFSVLEFGNIAVELVTNRGVMAELTRHRIGFSFAIQSTRYVRYDNLEFIKPVWCSDNLIGSYTVENILVSYTHSIKDLTTEEHSFFWSLVEVERKYRGLLDNGWRAEQAREVLPNALKTIIYMKGNYRAWRHLFELRLSKQAHPQFRQLLLPLFHEIRSRVPIVFEDIEYE